MIKLFFIIFFLLFSFQSLSKANEISEFEIEGMSIGDSLNNFVNEKDISAATDESYDDGKYLTKTFYKINLKNYEAIQVAYKANDKKRIIVGIGGVISYPNNISDCIKQMRIIDSELTNMFPKAIKKDWGKYNNNDNSGHYFPITYDFEDGSTAMVSCHDWNEETKINDNLKVSLFETNYSNYIKQKN